MLHALKSETKEYGIKWFYPISVLLSSLFLLFAFSIKEELKVGQNDGTLRIVAASENSQQSIGYSQTIKDITINGISITEKDIVRNDWEHTALDIVEPEFRTGGKNNDILEIKVKEPIKIVSFHYVKNVNAGVLKVYVGDEMVSAMDTYASSVDLSRGTFFAPKHYGLSLGNIGWYLLLLFFGTMLVFFCKFHIYRKVRLQDSVKLGVASLGTIALLYLVTRYVPEDYVTLFSMYYYPRSKVLLPVLLFLFFTQLTILTIRHLSFRKKDRTNQVDLLASRKKRRNDHHSHEVIHPIFSLAQSLFFCMTPLLGYFFLQNSYSRIGNVVATSHIYNIIILYVLFVCVTLILTSLRFTAILFLAGSLLIGILNMVMIDVRDAPLMYYNLFQMQDGLNVLNKVKFIFSQRIFQSTVFACILMSVVAFLPRLPYKIGWQKRLLISLIGLLVTVLGIPMMSKIIYKQANIKLSYWKIESTYSKNGFPLSFISYYEDAKIVEPKGYSPKKVESVLAQYPAQEQKGTNKLPNIVVIQNESQTDVTTLPNLKLSDDPLKFQHSLTENTVKGEVVVSSYGGGTANTEYETLTSNSLILLSSSVFPYQQLIHSERNSLVRYLKDLGYASVAMHPQPSNNYNRKNVYRYLGFDTAYFNDSEPSITELFDDLTHERGFVSDKSLFQGVQHLYKNKSKDSPLFSFVVTMQGHGGYIDPNYPTEVEVVGDQSAQFVAENEFLTSLKKTDQAFEELVSFFKNYDEPTIILMYGDHQPPLSQPFYETYYNPSDPSAKYRTPLTIWSNFEIDESGGKTMSPNYLAPYLLEVLSTSAYPIPQSSYYQFLNQTREQYPVVTSWGYYQDGEYSLNPDELNSLLKDYKLIEYNNVIDSKTLNKYFKP